MSRIIACMTDVADNLIANRIYNFVQDRGDLPTEDDVFQLFKQNDAFDSVFHSINHLFLEHMKLALLNAVSKENRSRFFKLLRIETQLRDDPGEDTFTIYCLGMVLQNPDDSDLFELYDYLVSLDQCAIASTDVNFHLSISINVWQTVVDRMVSGLDEGICKPTVESSCDTSTTIIEIGFLRDLAKTNTHAEENLNHIWAVLSEDAPEISKVKNVNPDFLVFYGLKNQTK